ncbi:hypothetical protein Pth03_33070 [Planotetraspora thailandica]|uniref:Uncharacterized protein n=1 Tax=Planotetraspora thailandica TaxID=487172 RepID=A0A8J3XYS5_9ACTN|nr:hypothetical protein Pth03_33070 [Planotetraspora thailandica]
MQRREAVIQGLCGPDRAEQAEARRIEDLHSRHCPLDLRMPEEGDHGGRDRHEEILRIPERGGLHTDEQVTHDAAADGGEEREHHHADHVEPFAHALQRSGQSETPE